MRRSTTTSFPSKLAALAATTVVLLATGAAAESHSGDAGKAAGKTMMATLHPVATGTGRVDEKMSRGTAKFTQGAGKVDVLIQVNDLPLGDREAGPASDGAPATVPFDVAVVKTGDCAKAEGSAELVKLPQLQVKDDGSGILMASTDKVTLEQLAGQAVLISVPGNKNRVGCGVIAAR
ncbi:MAG: hypothetical protein AB1689_12275 [Thermodesulfobacteriota bacterium]